MLSRDDNGMLPFDEEIAEVSVLLPGRQVLDLEQAAHERGLTAAQMLRRLVQDFLCRDISRSLQDAESHSVQYWA